MQRKLMIIGMTALNTGPLLSRMLDGGTGRKTRQEKNRYQISQKGKEFLANPPEEPQAKQEKPPAPPPVTPIVTPSAEVGDGDEGRDEGRREGKRQGKRLKKPPFLTMVNDCGNLYGKRHGKP